jgi:hypothetical protein
MRFFFSGPRFFGIRPGIILGPGDLSFLRPRSAKATGQLSGSFIYVLKGDHRLAKVGVSTNPDARLAQLRTASPFPIDYAFVGVTPGTGYDIEREAHAILANHRCNGEWFDVPPEMAVAAVHAAANRIGQPLQPLEPWMIAEIHRVAAREAAAAPAQSSKVYLAYVALAAAAILWLVASAVSMVVPPG